MTSLGLADCVRCTYVAIAMLAGCSGLQVPIGVPQSTVQGKSWMSPRAKQLKELLYVSDQSTSDVFVYNYQTGRQVGELTGFARPYGECVDAKGDVWITNYSGTSVVEYGHGGTSPLQALTAARSAIGCSISPSGDLAVAEFGIGQIQVWKNATGNPTNYPGNSACWHFWPPGYDDKGNLYAASSHSRYSVICELPSGSKSIRTVSASGVGLPPTGMMFDGKYMTLTGQSDSGGQYISRATEDRSGNLTVVSTSTFTDSCDSRYLDMVQPFIVGKDNTPKNRTEGTVVVAGNTYCFNRVDYWKYPAGGNPTKVLRSAPREPYGQAVSIQR